MSKASKTRGTPLLSRFITEWRKREDRHRDFFLVTRKELSFFQSTVERYFVIDDWNSMFNFLREVVISSPLSLPCIQRYIIRFCEDLLSEDERKEKLSEADFKKFVETIAHMKAMGI